MLGILFLLLLVGLRAPLAAGVVTLIGAGVVLSVPDPHTIARHIEQEPAALARLKPLGVARRLPHVPATDRPRARSSTGRSRD